MGILMAILLAAGQDYPDHVGVVNDFANEIDKEIKAKIEAVIADAKAKANVRLVIVTVSSLQGRTVEEYAVGLAKKWGVGQKGLNNGILFLHAPKERKIRIENGYGVESRLTDIESKMIIEKIIPLMKANRFAEAMLEGTREIDRVVTAPEKEPEKQSVSNSATPVGGESGGGSGMFILVVGIAVVLIIIFLVAMSSGGGSTPRRGTVSSPAPRAPQNQPTIPGIDPLSAATLAGLLAANKLPMPDPPPIPDAPVAPDPALSIEMLEEQRRRREEEERRRKRRREEEEEEDDRRRRSSSSDDSSSSSSWDSGSSSSSDSFGGGDFGGGGASGDY